MTLGPPKSAILICTTAAIFLTTALAFFLENDPNVPHGSMLRKARILLILAVAELAVYAFLVVVYRLAFHPLAKHPGPFWGKITDWYSVYHCWKGDRHIDFYKLHCRYGSVVRFGPDRISFNTETALRDIYSVRANVQKSQFFAVFSHFFKVPMSMTTIDRKKHAFKRRIDAQALTGPALKNYEENSLKNIRSFCRHLLDDEPSQSWNQAKDLTEWTSYVLSDIMGDNTFSRNWNMLESSKNRGIQETLGKGVAGLFMTGHMPGILKLKLDKILFRKLTEGTYEYQNLTKSQSEWRMAQEGSLKTKDIFGALLRAQDPETGRGFTHEELIAEAGLLIIAGSSTSASAIVATIFYCLHYPSTYDRLQREIRTAFADIDAIRSGQKLNSCCYLRACLDEAMRLSPGVAGIIPREVLKGGMTVDGIHFPEGTDVGVPHYALQHNEIYFPQPFAFKPERWIAGEGGVSRTDVSLLQSAFAPFSKGESSCVGMNLAYQTMSTTLAMMFWLYDMRLQPGSNLGEGHAGLGQDRERKDEFQCWDSFVAIHRGPMVEFRPRDVA